MHAPTPSTSGAGLGSLTRSATLGAVAIPVSPEDDEGDDTGRGSRSESFNGTSTAGDTVDTASSLAPSAAAQPVVQGPSPALLAEHLDTVQALLRSMEARLMARDAELVAAERRARAEAAKLGERGDELERLVEAQRVAV